MRRALTGRDWDVIISDWSMPGFSGLEALSIAREMDIEAPFLVISGTIGEAVAVQALQAGASDFMVKGQLSRLSPAIERGIAERKTRQARRAAERALRESEQRYRRMIE